MKITAELYDRAIKDEEFWADVIHEYGANRMLNPRLGDAFDRVADSLFVLVDALRDEREIVEREMLVAMAQPEG